MKRIRGKCKDLAVLNIQKGGDLTADDRIKAFRKAKLKFERYERPFIGLIHQACATRSGEFWDEFDMNIIDFG